MSYSQNNYPILYKVDSTGKRRFWKVYIDSSNKDTIIRHDGIDNPSAKVKELTYKTIKGNTLRTGEQQALNEIKKMWLSKIDQGFKPDSKDKEGNIFYDNIVALKNEQNSANTSIDVSTLSKTVDVLKGKDTQLKKIDVMLAKDFYTKDRQLASHTKKMLSSFPLEVCVQPKLDGIRCIASYENGEVILRSRNMKKFCYMDHIKKSLKNIFKNFPDTIFDGELYFHDPKIPNVERYQFVSSAVKVTRLEPHPEEEKIEYWVFDLIDTQSKTPLPFKDRFKVLSDTIFKDNYDSIILTKTIYRHFDIKTKQSDIISFLSNIFDTSVYHDTFEGIMVRNCKGLYKNGRSSDLLKYKMFMDEEWEIVDAKESVGGLQDGAVIWLLTNSEGLTVEAKQMGNVEYSKQLFLNKEKYIGKMINIRFNDKTADGIPRFPRATAIVDDK